MECSELTFKTQELILKCFRWGVCEEGIADIYQTTVKTVRLFQDKVATRAFIHHDEAAKELKDPSIECDEMHVKIGKDKHFWIGAAIAVPSLYNWVLVHQTLLPRDDKGRIQATDNLRIRPEKHEIQPGENYNPRHHGQHYHIETRRDPSQGWNKKTNVKKIEPKGYSLGDGTGFLPGENYPGIL